MSIKKKAKNLSRSFQMKTINEGLSLGGYQYNLSYPSPPSISGIIQNYFRIQNSNKWIFPTGYLNVKCDVFFEINNVRDYILSYSRPDDIMDDIIHKVLISEIKRLFPIPSSSSQQLTVNIDPSNPPTDQLIYYGPNSPLPNNIPLLDSYIVLKNQFVFYFYNLRQQEYRLAYFNLPN